MKTRLLFTVAAVLNAAAIAGGHDDVTVLRSDERSIVVEYRPKGMVARTVVYGDRQFVDFDFLGAQSSVSLDRVGVPDLKCRLLPLGFQAVEGNTLRILTADYEEVPNVLLKPVPRLQVRDEMLEARSYDPDPAAYAQNTFLPGPVAELWNIGRSRSMIVGSVRIHPIQYNPATRTVRKYNRIVVEVVYATSSAQRVRNADHELFKGELINYPVARSWMFGEARPLSRATGAPSVLAQGQWYRLTVAEEGMYILNQQFFAANGINLSGIDPRTIKIYGGDGRELPEAVNVPRSDDLLENAIYVEGESDGQFNAGDYVLFYGRGVQGVAYDAVARTMRHYIHHYSRVNYYWLTFGGAAGRRMAQQADAPGPATIVPTKFLDAVFIEPDTINIVRSGKDWVGPQIDPGGAYVRILPLAGVIADEPRTYRFALVGSSTSSSTMTVREGTTALGTYAIPQLLPYDYELAKRIVTEVSGVFPLTNNESQLRFEYQSASEGAKGYLDWVEVIYPRRLDAVNNVLRFRSPDTTGVVEYRLGQFTGAVSIFNVTDPANVRRVSATGTTFRAGETAGQVSEYFALTSAAYKQPVAVTSVTNQNLHGVSEQYDFIIITTPEFREAADRLREYRGQPAGGSFRTYVVLVDQIYNEFSHGVPDVTAIRDFLRYAYYNWTPQSPPRFVLFLGAASYDYKGILGTRSSYVPTWQTTANPFNDVTSSSTDDFFTRIEPNNRRPFFVSGRLNARTPAEASFLVQRVIAYEQHSERSPWRMRILFVADDGATSEGNDGKLHTLQSEMLAEQHTPSIFEKRKIYIEEYPTVQESQGRRKPGAYRDIIDEINRGALIVNFTGHGNPTVWTHESVFSVTTSIPQLTNANKLSVFFGATCNFSQFDDPRRYTGGELLMNHQGGGAIGVVSASRKVFADRNFELNRGIYDRMLRTDQFGRVVAERVATAIYQYKQISNDDNDEKYLLLGDPTFRLLFPGRFVAVDSINSQPVDSVDGLPRTSPIQLRSLARVTVKGSIRDANNAVDVSASGQLALLVNDARRRSLITTFVDGPLEYVASGATIYRGVSSVSNGRFTATFIVPKDIAYADSTSSGRIVGYFTDNATDGAGFTSKLWIGGTDPSAPADTIGPMIRMYLGHTYENALSFRPGDVVDEKPTLFVDLADSSGINTSISGVGHRIEAWINNSPDSKDMTDFYTSKIDNFRAGTVAYPLRDLPQGRNLIRVRAWDTYNNASVAETYFEVRSSDQLAVADVMNYPNPFRTSTVFTFRHNQAVPVNATVKVYTVAGRLIQTIEQLGISEPFVKIPWDGRDRDGDELANGVYLYKLIVRTVDGRFTSEVLGKLAIAR